MGTRLETISHDSQSRLVRESGNARLDRRIYRPYTWYRYFIVDWRVSKEWKSSLSVRFSYSRMFRREKRLEQHHVWHWSVKNGNDTAKYYDIRTKFQNNSLRTRCDRRSRRGAFIRSAYTGGPVYSRYESHGNVVFVVEVIVWGGRVVRQKDDN